MLETTGIYAVTMGIRWKTSNREQQTRQKLVCCLILLIFLFIAKINHAPNIETALPTWPNRVAPISSPIIWIVVIVGPIYRCPHTRSHCRKILWKNGHCETMIQVCHSAIYLCTLYTISIIYHQYPMPIMKFCNYNTIY